MSSFAERLREFVTARFKNQSAAAAALGISKGHMSSLLNEQGKPSDMLLNLIESKFGVSSKWLLTGEGDINVQPRGVAEGQSAFVLNIDDAIAAHNRGVINNMVGAIERILNEGDYKKTSALQSFLGVLDPDKDEGDI